MHDDSVSYCRRCGARGGYDRSRYDPRYCWYCFDGEADPARAFELIAAAAEGRRDALRMIADISDVRARDVLIDASGHESSEIRRAVLFSIALTGDRSATPAVAARLDASEDIRIRLAAVKALADLGGDAAIDALVPLLDDSDLCIDVAIALAWLRDPRAFPILIGAITEPDTRNSARTPAVALTWLGDRRAVRHLIRRLDEFAKALAVSDPPDSTSNGIGSDAPTPLRSNRISRPKRPH